MRYPTIAGSKTDGPSQEAAHQMTPQVLNLRGRTLACIQKHGGLTADECAEKMHLSVLSVRPRIAELNRMGKIVDSQTRRKNQSGRNATVWSPANV